MTWIDRIFLKGLSLTALKNPVDPRNPVILSKSLLRVLRASVVELLTGASLEVGRIVVVEVVDRRVKS